MKAFNPAVNIERVSYFDERFYRIQYLDGSIRNFTSVTEYLQVTPKPHLAIWRGNVGNQEADRRSNEAMSRGSRIHHACYTWIKGGMVLLDPPKEKELVTMNEKAAILRRQAMLEGRRTYDLREQDEYMAVERFVKLMRTLYVPPKPIAVVGSEVTMFSEQLDAAGTCDHIIPLDGGDYMINGAKPLALPSGVYIGDLKTGWEDNSHWMQLAAYSLMYQERTKQEPTGALLFYLDADTKQGIAGLKTVVRSFDQLMTDDLPAFKAAQLFYRRLHPHIEPKEFEMPMALMRTEEFVEIPTNYVLGFSEPPIQSLKIVPQMPKAEEKPKAAQTPKQEKKTPPAKANAQPEAPKKGDEGFFDAGTTQRYK